MIGTDKAGKADLGNDVAGILIEGSNRIIIDQNVISGNGTKGEAINGGIYVTNKNSTRVLIEGNIIGYDITMTAKLPNEGKQVTIANAAHTMSIIDNTIFGGNQDVVLDNAGVRVVISRNSMIAETGIGIDLNADGVTPNDFLDLDSGPNNLQNYPVLQTAIVQNSQITISGYLESNISTVYTIEFFGNDALNASGYAAGQYYLGSTVVETDATYGKASFTKVLSNPKGLYLTSTAIKMENIDGDPNTPLEMSDTSEFSQHIVVNWPTLLSINDVSQNEGNSGSTAFSFTVSLSVAVPETVTVDYWVVDGTATLADNDYVAASGTLTFDPYQTTKAVTVYVNGDNKFEVAEQFYVQLSNATNAAIADNMGVGTINNDDLQPTIAINDVTQLEGNSGTTNFVFTVSLANPSAETITVNFASGDSTAVAPGDYAATSGALTFNPGETTKTITVAVVGDTVGESDEVFNVNLSNPVGATLADFLGVGMIWNDDTTINIGDATMTEGNFGVKMFTFTISLTHASHLTVTANWATANGTATAGTDYQAGSGSVTFNPGEMQKTVTVMVTGDMTPEANETFYVDLSSIVNAMFGDLQGLATILNDD